MIRTTIITLLLTALAGAAQAQDATPAAYFERFERYCIATGGDPVLAMQAAEADGWTPAPQAMIDEIINPNAPEAAARLSLETALGSAKLATSASGEMPGHPGIKVRTCMIEPSGQSYDVAALRALVEARLEQQSPVDVWAYSGAGPFADETPTVMEGMDAMAVRARETPVFVLNLIAEDGVSGLVLLRVGS